MCHVSVTSGATVLQRAGAAKMWPRGRGKGENTPVRGDAAPSTLLRSSASPCCVHVQVCSILDAGAASTHCACILQLPKGKE
eukprot:2474599-Pleurochrysis_carterae.AAC.2